MKREEKLPKWPPYLQKPVEELTNEVIAPRTGGTPVYWDIDRSEMDEIVANLKILYVFGRIIYRDTFNEERETRYCFRYYPAVANQAEVHVGFFVEGPPDYMVVR